MTAIPLNLPPLSLSIIRRRAVPMVFQSEAAECGLACLCMIARYFKDGSDMTELRQKYGVSLRGATLKSIMDMAADMGLSARALKLETEHVKQLTLPCILHWDLQHFVVLTKVSQRGVVIHDPALGERALNWDDVGNHFTGIALEITPTSEFKPARQAPTLTLRHFWQRIVGLKRHLLILFALSALIQLFAIASPYYMQTVIDDVLLRQQRDLLLVLALGFGMLLLIESATSVLRRMAILALSSRLHQQMSANVFHHLIRLPVSYFSKRHMGDVVSRFGSLSQVRELLTVGVVTAVLDGLLALVTLAVMMVYSVTLSGIVAVVVLIYLAARIALISTMKRLNAERISIAAKEQSHFMESIRAIQTVKQFGQEMNRQSQWQNKLADTINTDIRLGKWDISVSCLNQLLFGFENILIIYFAATEVMDNAMTVGMLYAFIAYKTRFITAIDGLINKAIEFKMVAVHFERLADIVFTKQESFLQTAPSLPQLSDNIIDAPTRPLVIKDLCYRYSPADAPVFENINLTIEAGSTVAIVGPSGAGKTTLLKCLMGLLPPSQGDVLYGGDSVFSAGVFRQLTSSVLQDDNCLSGSIMDNITCFTDSPDFERMVQAALKACIHEEIMAMPMQYQTLVGDMGSTLSGGQLQRLLLARALYRQPKILFLDEASSHLDLNNEAAINQHLKALAITRVVVAHRSETIAMADRIYLLRNGTLCEVPHSAVLSSPSPTSKNPPGENYD
ncbi:peptidase domain-containing ABC transporter [Alteromonas pelagimontana]|uniref:Peptidase domain-containing ABC transporter n=1 Tax=Alteromonas pelagimontana TaxID=1858656 RepID=A0A6M4MFM8_9ALTE|nr:peptidase domain-containing ABC transporter [Alteromonas pelagimontana]QJR81470.1 peptidase domain-containing ABC transporter [Alteromonas pelagimontana]